LGPIIPPGHFLLLKLLVPQKYKKGLPFGNSLPGEQRFSQMDKIKKDVSSSDTLHKDLILIVYDAVQKRLFW